MADLDRRIEERAGLVVLDDLAGFGAQLRREVNQRVVGELLDLQRLWLRRKRLRWRQDLSRKIRGGDGTLFNRPDRLSRLAVEHVGEALLRGLHHDRGALAVDRDVEQ